MNASPNVFSLHDFVEFKDGRFWRRVKIIGFIDKLVQIRLPDGARRRVAYGALRRVAE